MQDVDVLYDDGAGDAIEGNVRPGDSVITDGQLRVLPDKSVAIVKLATGSKPATP